MRKIILPDKGGSQPGFGIRDINAGSKLAVFPGIFAKAQFPTL
jgi:hypothetical protein